MKICTSRGYFLSYLERNLHILNSDCSYLLFTFRNRFEVNYFMYRLWGSNWCFNKPTFCTINIEKYYTKKQGGRDNTIFLSDQILGFQFKKLTIFNCGFITYVTYAFMLQVNNVRMIKKPRLYLQWYRCE